MVVGVRKNMMLLFENKLSYIFCVVGAGVTNAESAWWFIKLNQRCWLACLLCVIFYHVFCEIWINCGYVWLRCCRIGDKCVVLLPEALLAYGYCHRLCLCVYLCVCQLLLVRAITHHMFHLQSPDSDKRCKTFCLRCLLFWGLIKHKLPGQI